MTTVATPDLQALPDLGAGFATVEQVETAAALLGGRNGVLGGRWAVTGPLSAAPVATPLPELTKRYRLLVSPGSVRLRVLDQPGGWEERLPEVKPRPEQLVLEVENPEHTCVEQLPEAPSTWWSPRSRARMVRVLATVDWLPVMLAPGTRPAMVTLTYPGDWRAAAPDSEATKRHLAAYRKRLVRLFDVNGLERPAGVWKLEFQRRGAPHFHVYQPVPVGPIRWRCGRWCQGHEGRFRDWLSWAWADVVGSGERAAHQAAGTGVDFAEGSRMSDPKRLAVYFVRHNAKGGKSKAYQHRVPEGWGKAGRWWGTWAVERLEVEVECESWELAEVRRFLRRYTESERIKGPRRSDLGGTRSPASAVPRCSPKQVARGVASTGEQRRRWLNRRYRVASLHGSLGGFVVSNDGPALAALAARWLDHERERRAGLTGPPATRVLP